MQHRVYTLLVEKNEIAWKTILLELIKNQEMDPWDVDLSQLAQMYIKRIKELKESDLKLSGKVLLAAAILLRVKSKRLVGEDLDEFDRLLAGSEENDEFFDEDPIIREVAAEEDKPQLIPRTPLPRKRKVSVFDLVRALEKALEVKHRRLIKKTMPEVELKLPEEKIDISLVMKRLFLRVREFFLFKRGKKLEFSQVVTSKDKQQQLRELLGLLHLATAQKIRLKQAEPFGSIDIKLNSRAPIDDEQKTLA